MAATLGAFVASSPAHPAMIVAERVPGLQADKPARTVRGRMQPRPGAPEKDVEVAAHEVATDVPSIPAKQARLADDELVLGVVRDGHAIAYPVRYLAQHEVINSEIDDTPVARTW